MFHEKNEKIQKKSRDETSKMPFGHLSLGHVRGRILKKTQTKAILFVNLAVMFNFM